MTAGNDSMEHSRVNVQLEARPERRLIRPGGSFRHIDFRVRVEVKAGPRVERSPLSLALVLDRSGSMSGDKLATAKRAALTVLHQLDERDRLAVVVFDSEVDVLQPAAQVTHRVRAAMQDALARVEARACTALHEGWLTGCQAIAADGSLPEAGPARCFLLTDGLANEGLTDPERIAAEAAQVREHAGIGTSTFGIGPDYDEGLLAPMAVAGGGQFHHLRTAGEIADTFAGELGELLAVAASRVSIELEAGPGVRPEVISAYRPFDAGGNRVSIGIGDLLAGEERHVVVRFGFPPAFGPDRHMVRARVVWLAGGVQQAGPWCEVPFTYASDAVCNTEAQDRTAMHWIGLHHSERAKSEAIRRNRRGDLEGARTSLQQVRRRLARYASGDPDLEAALQELKSLEGQVSAMPMDSMTTKELYYSIHRVSRGQRDHRHSGD